MRPSGLEDSPRGVGFKSMPLSALDKPATDPTPIFEAFRGSYGTELLTAAVAHFDLFGRLARQPLSTGELAAELHLAERPASVLATALRAMGLLNLADGRLHLSAVAREHLLPAAPFDVGDYIGLAAQSPGVLAMVERLRKSPGGRGRVGHRVHLSGRRRVGDGAGRVGPPLHVGTGGPSQERRSASRGARAADGRSAARQRRRRHRHLQHRAVAAQSGPARW